MSEEDPTQDQCSLCGETMGEDDRAEMNDPADPLNGGLVHPECGLQAGWVIS